MVEAAEQVLGRSLEDRPGSRRVAEQGRSATVIAAQRLLEGTHLEGQQWVSDWFAAARADGLLVRGPDATAALVGAARALLVLTGPPTERLRTRTEIAARVLHDAHALDDDRATGRLVLRGLARREGRPLPTDATQRRGLWDAVGVLPDLVSTTCATVGVRWADPDDTAAYAAGPPRRPWHVTGWDVRRRGLVAAPGQRVLVCENPAVLQAFAESGPPELGVVCTSGRPNLVVQAVLDRLTDAGAHLRYHGDFDWPGVAIADPVRARFAARTWRMGAVGYDAAPGELPLQVSDDTEPSWDRELGAAMRRRGVAVHEEAVLDVLLAAADLLL